MADTPSPKRGFPVALVVAIPVAIFGFLIVAFLAIWQFLTPSSKHVIVAYSDFVSEVRAGKVEEIQIRDREYRYRLKSTDGRLVLKETIGPPTDDKCFASLRPDDPNLPAPRISFEK
jgi:ATP-dependent Zn protease